MRALLLPGPAHKMDSNEMITCGELRERGRAFERSEALVTVFADWELLHAADADARAQADTRRLRWLAAEHDLSEHVAFVAASKGALALALHSDELEERGAGQPLAPPPPPLSLARLVSLKWLNSTRRLHLMALLALSLHQRMPGALVHEALFELLSPEVAPDHVATVSRLPPCLRAALLLLLGRAADSSTRSSASQTLWRFISWAAIFHDSAQTNSTDGSLANAGQAGLGALEAIQTPAAAAAFEAFESGYTECAGLVRKILRDLPSWRNFEQSTEPSMDPHSIAPAPPPIFDPLASTSARVGKAFSGAEEDHEWRRSKDPSKALAAAATRGENAIMPSPSSNRKKPHGGPGGSPHPRGRGGGKSHSSIAAQHEKQEIDKAEARAVRRAAEEEARRRAEEATDAASRAARMADAYNRASKLPGGGSRAALYADNLSWGPAFMIGHPGANLRRAGGDANPNPTSGKAAGMSWSHLEAPSYLLKRRDQTFLHVTHSSPPVGIAQRVDMVVKAETGDSRAATPGGGGRVRTPSAAVLGSLDDLRAALLREMTRVMDVFRKIDINRDGKVSSSEFRSILPILAPRPPAEVAKTGEMPDARFSIGDLDALFETIDRDGSGSIDYAELNAVLRQGLGVALKSDAVDVRKLKAGEVGFEKESKNKLSLRGNSAKKNKRGGGGDGGGGSGGEDDDWRMTGDLGIEEDNSSSRPGSRGNLPSPPREFKPPALRPPFFGANREAVVSPPLVSQAKHRSGKTVVNMNSEQTWFAVPAKNDFVLQPQRARDVLPRQQSQSKLWQSVQAYRRSTESLSSELHSVSSLKNLSSDSGVGRSRTLLGTDKPSWRAHLPSTQIRQTTAGGLSEEEAAFLGSAERAYKAGPAPAAAAVRQTPKSNKAGGGAAGLYPSSSAPILDPPVQANAPSAGCMNASYGGYVPGGPCHGLSASASAARLPDGRIQRKVPLPQPRLSGTQQGGPIAVTAAVEVPRGWTPPGAWGGMPPSPWLGLPEDWQGGNGRGITSAGSSRGEGPL